MDLHSTKSGLWCLCYLFVLRISVSGLIFGGMVCHQWTSTFDNIARDHCYWYADLPESMTAEEANDFCGGAGGTLAPYIDEDQYRHLKEAIPLGGRYRNTYQMQDMIEGTGICLVHFNEVNLQVPLLTDTWIGLNDKDTDTVWVNWNGEPTSVMDDSGNGNWKHGEPDGIHSDGHSHGNDDEDCVVVASLSSYWEDKSCNDKERGAVCYLDNLNQVISTTSTSVSSVPDNILSTKSVLSGLYQMDSDKSRVVFLEDQIFAVLVTRLNPCLVQCNIYNSCVSVVFVTGDNLCFGYNRIFSSESVTRVEIKAKYYHKIQ